MKKSDRPKKNFWFSLKQFSEGFRSSWIFTGKYLDLRKQYPYLRITGEDVTEALAEDLARKEQKKIKKPDRKKDRTPFFVALRNFRKEFWSTYSSTYHRKTPISEWAIIGDFFRYIYSSNSVIEGMINKTQLLNDLDEYDLQQAESENPTSETEKKKRLWYNLEPILGFILVVLIIIVALGILGAFIGAMIEKIN